MARRGQDQLGSAGCRNVYHYWNQVPHKDVAQIWDQVILSCEPDNIVLVSYNKATYNQRRRDNLWTNIQTLDGDNVL